MSKVQDLQAGFVLAGRYTVVRFLGRGAFGTVYECTDSVLADLPVAVKLYPRQNSRTKGYSPRVHREILLCQKVSHPNVAAFYDCIQTEQLIGYSMELVDGSSFEELIRDGRTLKTTDLIRFFKQLIRGLDAIHSAGVIHRDIKPSNILFTHLKEAKISDFGISNQRVFEDAQEDQPEDRMEDIQKKSLACSHAGRLVGTPLYLAPEYIAKGVYDERSDLYSCGAMWYEILTGQPPHNHTELPELLISKVQDIPPSAREINPNCSEVLNDIVMGLIAKDPEERFQSARDVERELLKIEQKIEKVRRRAKEQAAGHLHGDLFDIKHGTASSGKEEIRTPSEPDLEEYSGGALPLDLFRNADSRTGPLVWLEIIWDKISERSFVIPMTLAIVLISFITAGAKALKGSTPPPAPQSVAAQPTPQYRSTIVSKSEVLRSMDDARRIRSQEANKEAAAPQADLP